MSPMDEMKIFEVSNRLTILKSQANIIRRKGTISSKTCTKILAPKWWMLMDKGKSIECRDRFEQGMVGILI